MAVVRDVRVNMGYRVLSTSGNRPLNYHQPYAGLVVPLNRRIAWTTEWRYYGYNERGASLQDFHNHLITVACGSVTEWPEGQVKGNICDVTQDLNQQGGRE